MAMASSHPVYILFESGPRHRLVLCLKPAGVQDSLRKITSKVPEGIGSTCQKLHMLISMQSTPHRQLWIESEGLGDEA
jgi:hypothetical protein